MSNGEKVCDRAIQASQTADGIAGIQVLHEEVNLWHFQRRMAAFSACAGKRRISLKTICISHEPDESATAKESLAVQPEGGRQVQRQTICRSSKAIIAVGIRVDSNQSTQFRQWAAFQRPAFDSNPENPTDTHRTGGTLMTFQILTESPASENRDVFAAVRDLLLENGRPKTWAHVQAVADKCVEIGRAYSIDEENCRRAGLLHDVSAVIPAADMLAYAESQGWEIDPAERAHPFLLHQRLSEVAAQRYFHIADEDVLAAIRCHTTLRARPTPCDMALFLADKLAWDQPGEPPFRREIEDGLSVSLEQASLNYIDYAMTHGMILQPHRWLLEARNWLRAQVQPSDGSAR